MHGGAEDDADSTAMETDGDSIKGEDAFGQFDEDDSDVDLCLVLPCPWCPDLNTRIGERERFLISNYWDRALPLVYDFFSGEAEPDRFVTVPGLRCELQYLRLDDGRHLFLFRPGLSPYRRAALLCVLLEAISDPETFANVQGAPDWWQLDWEEHPERYV